SRRILLFQPNQARSRAPRARLATFIVSSRRSPRPIPARLGGRGRAEWRVRRTWPVAVGRISRRRNPPSFGGKKDGGLRCANPPYGLARLPRCAHARVRGLTADNGRQMFDKPLACGA